jgi:hypothetical protein
VIANWDGQQYRNIVEHGYPHELPRENGQVQQNAWAFYPLYPALVRLVMATGLSFGWSASVVSITAGALGMCLLHLLLRERLGDFGAAVTVLGLCTFAAAVTFQAAYTESLALLLVLVALWGLRRRHYAVVTAAGLALSLTRPIVPALALVVLLHGVSRWNNRRTDPFARRDQVKVLLSAGSIGLSFLLWPAIAGWVTGEPNAYLMTQHAWTPGTHSWPSWLAVVAQGAATIGQGGGGSVAQVDLFLVPAVVGAWLCVVWRRPAGLFGAELRSWALAYPAYLLVSTRPTTSVFRYAMLALVLWWPLPELSVAARSLRARVVLTSFVVLFGLASQVEWMRSFFVFGPATVSIP